MSDTSKRKTVAPNLAEFMARREREILTKMNCVQLGTIKAFDSAKQTATVAINFMRVQKDIPTEDKELVDQTVNYPLLVNCPVFILFGGTGRITFPIAAGDSCLVLFCDRDIDGWYKNGATLPPNSERVHDLNDGIALVVIKSLIAPLTGYNTSGPEISNGTAKIAVEDKIRLIVGSQTLLDALDSLCAALTGSTDTRGDAFDSGTVAAINAAKAKIDAVLKA